MTVDLPFKSVEEEIVGWKPLENLKEENENKELLKPLINEKRKLSATDWYKRFGDEEEEEEKEEEEINKKIILDPSDIAALINEGAEFCPIIKREQQNEEGEDGENIKSKSGEVLDWKPLEQINILIEEKKEQKINEEYLVNDNQNNNNIFKESKESLFNSLKEEEHQLPIISSRKSTKSEALDIVSEWNNKLIKKKVEENLDGNKEEEEEEKVNIDIHLNGDNWQANSKVLILPLTKLEKAEFNIKNNKSIVEQCEEEGHLKTIVHLNSPPKKPQRTSLDSEPNFQKINRKNEEEKKILFSSNNSSKTQQIHHKMQMRRCRRRPLSSSKLNRNLLTIEHINITQLEYLGGDMLERIEKGERIVTNISTKLNNFAENELFNKLDFQKNERINKFVEIKRNRSEETGKIKTETKITKSQLKNKNNEEIKKENASLYTEIISNNNSENPSFSNKNKIIWRNIPIKQQKISSPSRISITTTQGGILNKNNEGNCVTVKHTPGTNWCISSIYKTTEYGWEKQTLKPRFVTKFDEMPRRTST
nr:unnamed protein product [Meloidogyne enterolobii]